MNHDADLCQCCRLCIAFPGDPQGQIPQLLENTLPQSCHGQRFQERIHQQISVCRIWKVAHMPFACCWATGQTEPYIDGQSLLTCLQLLLYGDDKDIKVMALEAHSSHYSQPLDKNPFSAFKNEFNFQMKRFN